MFICGDFTLTKSKQFNQASEAPFDPKASKQAFLPFVSDVDARYQEITLMSQLEHHLPAPGDTHTRTHAHIHTYPTPTEEKKIASR